MEWTPEAIRKRRDELGLTQQELAEQLKVSLRTVTSWESGTAKPRRSSTLNDVLGSPPNSTAERLDLTRLSNGELFALNVALAYENARRLGDDDGPDPGRRPMSHTDPSSLPTVPTGDPVPWDDDEDQAERRA